jgi:hypothetical protein
LLFNVCWRLYFRIAKEALELYIAMLKTRRDLVD